MKKSMALLLTVIVAISLFAGCGGSSGSGVSSGTGEVRHDIKIGITADPGTFSPYVFGGQDYNKIKMSIYQSLAFFTLDKEFEPVIAESWKQIDPLTYTVKIKENVYDSEKNHITANDVYFSCQKHLASAMASAWKYSDPENPVEVTGEYELTYHFKQETSSAFTSLLTGVSIVSEKAFNESPDEFVNSPVGTGPYKLKNWVVSSEVTLEKNDNYWDDSPYKYFVQNMDEITYKIIPEAGQRAIELETGGIDFIYDAQATDVARLKSNPDYVSYSEFVNKVLLIYFNCTENSPFQDKRLRHAVAYAVDSKAIATAVCSGLGEASNSITIPINMEWRDRYADRVLYEQNIEKAKELVDELKAEGKEIDFTIMTDENPTKGASAAVIQEACKTIGIEVKVDQLESAVFQAKYGDMTAWDAYMGLGGSSAVYCVQQQTGQVDRTGYPNPSELRTALDTAFIRYDEKTSDTAIALFEEEIPMLPLVSVDSVFCYKKGLKGAETLDFANMIHPGSCYWE